MIDYCQAFDSVVPGAQKKPQMRNSVMRERSSAKHSTFQSGLAADDDELGCKASSRKTLMITGRSQRKTVAAVPFRKGMSEWIANPNRDLFEAPTGVHPLELQHTVSMLAVLIGVIPAFIGAATVYWSSDTTFMTLGDLPVLVKTGNLLRAQDSQLSIMRKNKYLINTPDAYSPEPFASLTNLCFFSAGLGFVSPR